MPIIDAVATGKNIRRLLFEKGITIAQVCDELHISSTQSIYHWLNGKNLPTIDHLVDLAELLDTSVEDILVLRSRDDKR